MLPFVTKVITYNIFEYGRDSTLLSPKTETVSISKMSGPARHYSILQGFYQDYLYA